MDDVLHALFKSHRLGKANNELLNFWRPLPNNKKKEAKLLESYFNMLRLIYITPLLLLLLIACDNDNVKNNKVELTIFNKHLLQEFDQYETSWKKKDRVLSFKTKK